MSDANFGAGFIWVLAAVGVCVLVTVLCLLWYCFRSNRWCQADLDRAPYPYDYSNIPTTQEYSTSSNRAVQDQLGKCNVRNRDLETERAVLQSQLSSQQDSIAKLQKEKNDLTKSIIQLEKDNKKSSERIAQLQSDYNTLVRTTGKQISVEISQDETKTENISRKCRPSTVRETYVILTFQKASNLKQQLHGPKEMSDYLWKMFIDRVFCSIYITAANHMQKLCSERMRATLDFLQHPLSSQKASASCNAKPAPEDRTSSLHNISYAMTNYLLDNATEEEPDDNLVMIVGKEAIDVARKQMPEQDCDVSKAVFLLCEGFDKNSDHVWAGDWQQFIRDICRLTWKMAIQRPPIIFTTPDIGKMVNLKEHNVIPLKDKGDENLIISYYLEPNLVHGKTLLEKGRVRPVKQESSEQCVIPIEEDNQAFKPTCTNGIE